MLYVFKNSTEQINTFNIGNYTSTSVRKIAEITCSVMELDPSFSLPVVTEVG